MAGKGRKRVIVAMSGGVDSSVAAALLLDAGYDVTGVFLCLGMSEIHDAGTGTCCSPEDAADAQRVADSLGIELLTLPVASAFEPIKDNFAAEYARGRTPNPCIHCNARVKVKHLVGLADHVGAGHVATGHYARCMQTGDGPPSLARGQARSKDQSYALFALPRDVLGRLRFPIGDLADKGRVRQVASERGLPVHDKQESQEICFVPDGDYTTVLRERAPEALRPGPIVRRSGETVGRHDGYARFTIGQRRGLGVSAEQPLYVTDIDPDTATVTVGPIEETLSSGLAAAAANWHRDPPREFDALVQIRYNHDGAPGRVRVTSDTTFEVDFAEPVSAIAPGQAAVVYAGERLLGGGWIERDQRV